MVHISYQGGGTTGTMSNVTQAAVLGVMLVVDPHLKESKLSRLWKLIDDGNFLLIYIWNLHVLSHLLLIYICKLHWNLNTMFVCQVIFF